MREHILKGAGHRGGTGGPGPNTGPGSTLGDKVVTRSEFEKLSSQRRSDMLVKDGFRVVDG